MTRTGTGTTTPVLLRAGLRVLPRAADELQIGTDPRWAVRLTGLGHTEMRWWASVDDATDLTALPGRAADAGLDAATVASTIADLHRAGLTRARPDGPPGPRTAETTAWGLVRPDTTGEAVVAARSRAVVGVTGLGPTGLGVALQLAAAGVGTLLVDDDAVVRSADATAGPYQWADVGTPRVVAARRTLRDAAPRTRVEHDGTPDVVVLVEHDAADPTVAARLVSAGVPHLSVVLRAADAHVGPLVRPGTDPCLQCVDLHRTDADPAWPTLLNAVTARRPGLSGPAEVGVMATVCAGLAAAQVLTHLAGTRPVTCGATLEVRLPDLQVRHRSWAPHDACGCRTPPGTTDAGPHEA